VLYDVLAPLHMLADQFLDLPRILCLHRAHDLFVIFHGPVKAGVRAKDDTIIFLMSSYSRSESCVRSFLGRQTDAVVRGRVVTTDYLWKNRDFFRRVEKRRYPRKQVTISAYVEVCDAGATRYGAA